MDNTEGISLYKFVIIACVLIIVVVGVALYFTAGLSELEINELIDQNIGNCTEWENQFTLDFANDQCYKGNYTNCEIRFDGDIMIIDYLKFERYNETYNCTEWEGGSREYQRALIVGDPEAEGEFCEYAEDKDTCCKVKNGEVGYWDERWVGCVKKGN